MVIPPQAARHEEFAVDTQRKEETRQYRQNPDDGFRLRADVLHGSGGHGPGNGDGAVAGREGDHGQVRLETKRSCVDNNRETVVLQGYQSEEQSG